MPDRIAANVRPIVRHGVPDLHLHGDQHFAAAQGDVLLFLHADTRFPADGLARLRQALASDPACPGGNFRLLFEGTRPFCRWLEGFYAWIRSHGVYYGDSGIFVRRAVYERIGGFRPIALMEDYDFTRRLERAGKTCCIEEPALVTSARRFEGRWPPAIVWGWLEIHALYHLGLPPALLAKRYDSRRRRGRPAARRESSLKGATG